MGCYKFILSKDKYDKKSWILEIENDEGIYTLFLDSNQIEYLLKVIHGQVF